MITFKCPKGQALIVAPTIAELTAKRAIHAAIFHENGQTEPCHARQAVAPMVRAYRNSSAVGHVADFGSANWYY